MDMRGRRAAAAADDIDKTCCPRTRRRARPYIRGFRHKDRTHSAGRRWDRRRRAYRRSRESSARWARISRAPSAQLRPIVKGFAWRSEYQKAAGVWPDSVRPDRSVMVPEIMTGRRSPRFFENAVDAKQRRLGVERVEDCLDNQKIGAALDQRARRFRIGVAQFVEAHRAKAGIVDSRAKSRRCDWSAPRRRRRSGDFRPFVPPRLPPRGRAAPRRNSIRRQALPSRNRLARSASS